MRETYFWSIRPRSPPTVRFARYCPYPRLKDSCRDDVTSNGTSDPIIFFYVLDGEITPLRINRIANPEYKSGRLWRDEEKTWTLRGNEQQPKTLAGPLKVILKKSNRISWDLSSCEYGRLAEGIVSGRQPLINLLVKSKLKNIMRRSIRKFNIPPRATPGHLNF